MKDEVVYALVRQLRTEYKVHQKDIWWNGDNSSRVHLVPPSIPLEKTRWVDIQHSGGKVWLQSGGNRVLECEIADPASVDQIMEFVEIEKNGGLRAVQLGSIRAFVQRAHNCIRDMAVKVIRSELPVVDLWDSDDHGVRIVFEIHRAEMAARRRYDLLPALDRSVRYVEVWGEDRTIGLQNSDRETVWLDQIEGWQQLAIDFATKEYKRRQRHSLGKT
jgi:hypothetical protein